MSTSRATVLYSSAEIHAQIKRLLSNPSEQDRRVVLVAYVGADGVSYLPHPKGLRVICSPTPGATDPDALRDLVKRGATVEFSAKLHMKVYWSRLRGCIIGSANASKSALGVGGLKETAVSFPPGVVDVKRLIKYASPEPITQQALHRLDRLGRAAKRKRTHRGQRTSPFQKRTFLDWYNSPYHSSWKLGWAGTDIVEGNARVVKEQTFSEYGLREPHTYLYADRKRIQANDWLLHFTFSGLGISDIRWVYADFVVKIEPKEKKYYFRKWPCHAVQVYPLSQYPAPPFCITPEFRRALRMAVAEYTKDRIVEAKTDVPPIRLLRGIAEAMRKQ